MPIPAVPVAGAAFVCVGNAKKGGPRATLDIVCPKVKIQKSMERAQKKDALLRRLRQRAKNGGLELFSPTVLQVFDVVILAWRGRHCYVGFRNNAEPNRHSWTVLMRTAAPRRMNNRLCGPFRRWRPGAGTDRQPGLRW